MLLSDAIRNYLSDLKTTSSRHTARNAKSALKELVAVMATQGIDSIEQLNHEALARFREELAERNTPRGAPLSPRSQSERLGSVRAFCRWMVRQDWLVTDPSERIPNPRKPRQLPKSILTEEELEKAMAVPDMHTATGYRDRTILEVLYSSGLRREEAARLLLDDVDTDGGYLTVRKGKNGKDRVVPVGASVCALLDAYIAGIRPEWVGADKDPHLFLNRFGKGMDPQAIYHIVKKCLRAAGIKKKAATHTFRHTCATDMARAGAPIRHLQEMLGHESIETTQVYTQLAITDLKAAHKRFHPREQDSGNDR